MSRPRKDPARAYKVTLDVLNAALARDSWEAYWGGPEEARRAWSVLRGKIRGNPYERDTIELEVEGDL